MTISIDELEFTCPQRPSKRSRTSSADRTPAPSPPGRSVTQMRLDRIWQEQSPTQWTEYVHWRREFLAHPARFPTERLVTWLDEVDAMLPLIREQVAHPPAHWTGDRWDQAHELLLRLKGQRQAVEQTLTERGVPCVGTGCGPGLKPCGFTAGTASDRSAA